MPTKLSDLHVKVERDAAAFKAGTAPKGVVTCVYCSIPLQESVTGMRPVGKGKFSCSDDYFDALSDELDKFPVSAGRAPRGG